VRRCLGGFIRTDARSGLCSFLDKIGRGESTASICAREDGNKVTIGRAEVCWYLNVDLKNYRVVMC